MHTFEEIHFFKATGNTKTNSTRVTAAQRSYTEKLLFESILRENQTSLFFTRCRLVCL